MNKRKPEYTHSYIKECIENVVPGSYVWVKNYLYPSTYTYKRLTDRPLATYQNLRQARTLGVLESRKNRLDGMIHQNLILAQRELRIFHQERYYPRPRQDVDPYAHYFWFTRHINRASAFYAQLVTLSL